MKVFLIVVAHIVGVFSLILVGLRLNDAISKDYAGLVTLFSVAITAYITFLNALYQKSYAFHLLINRLRLRFSRTHTFWQPHFHFEMEADKCVGPLLLNELWQLLSKGEYGQAVRQSQTPSKLVVSLDSLLTIQLRINDNSLDLGFEHKFLVPSHLYDQYRFRLARLAEDITKIVRPVKTAYGIQVSFGDGARNPYYGFFVNRVPMSLLQDFQVTFRLDAKSDCRIEAGTDHVNVEAGCLTDAFEALNQVLRLRALPKGVPT